VLRARERERSTVSSTWLARVLAPRSENARRRHDDKLGPRESSGIRSVDREILSLTQGTLSPPLPRAGCFPCAAAVSRKYRGDAKLLAARGLANAAVLEPSVARKCAREAERERETERGKGEGGMGYMARDTRPRLTDHFPRSRARVT